MTVAELKREVEKLDPTGQTELVAYLFHLRVTRHEAWRAEMGGILDDPESHRWIPMAPVDWGLAEG